jgi:hypothetical protein
LFVINAVVRLVSNLTNSVNSCLHIQSDEGKIVGDNYFLLEMAFRVSASRENGSRLFNLLPSLIPNWKTRFGFHVSLSFVSIFVAAGNNVTLSPGRQGRRIV